MLEKELAQQIYNNLKLKSKYNNFIANIIKPKDDPQYNNYNLNKLKDESKKLGIYIFLPNEINRPEYHHEIGETLIASFYDINAL